MADDSIASDFVAAISADFRAIFYLLLGTFSWGAGPGPPGSLRLRFKGVSRLFFSPLCRFLALYPRLSHLIDIFNY